MKKMMIMALAALCLLLAGCDSQSDTLIDGETGNYYNEFMSEAGKSGGYQVTAEAHVEDVLSLVYLQVAEAKTLNMELEVGESQGDFMLYLVRADGTEFKLAGTVDTDIKDPLAWELPLELDAGESRLEWRAENGAELQFKLILCDTDGVEIFMRSPADEAAWNEMADGLDTLEKLPNGSTAGGPSMSLHNIDKQLAANEPQLLLNCPAEEKRDVPLKAALWDFSGDAQLVYVQPDGTEQPLWDSREPDGAEQPQRWQTPWEYVLPEDVDAAELLTIDLTVELLPGEGRLEWRTEGGAEFKLNILLENLKNLNNIYYLGPYSYDVSL